MKDSKREMPKRIIGLIVAIAILLVAMVIFLVFQSRNEFDAGKYVTTILDYTFKGNTKEPEVIFDEKSLTQLENQYESQMKNFVDKSITGGVKMDDTMQEKYMALCKKIFAAMKYQVKTIHKVSKDEYKVTIEYQVSNVFPNYMETAKAEQQKILDKVNKGEYKGTTEEIEQQMREEGIQNNYTALQTAFEGAEYLQADVFIFTVKRGENELFSLDGNQLSKFHAKILGLDEIQD